MATEQVTVIEGDGSSDNVTVTDDPVEDSTVQAVVDRLERVLKDQDNIDEVRVALTADDLPGNLDVSVEDQAGDVAVTLDGETVSVDSLPSLPQGSNRVGSVVVDGQPVGVSVDGQTGDLEVTLGAETVSVDSLPAVDISSQSAGIATESTLDAIKAAAQALDDALASSGTDEIRVMSPSPLDVSASEVDVNLNSQTLTNVSVDLNAQSGPALDVSGATVTVTDDGALTLAANDGTDIGDVGIEDISLVTGQATKSGSLPVTLASDEDTVSVQEDTPLDVSAAEVDVDLASQTGPALDVSGATVAVQEASALDVSAATVEVQEATALDVSGATVPTEQQSPVKVENTNGTAIDPATEGKLEQVRSLLDGLDDALASVASDTLRTEQQTPVGVEDSTGTQIDPASNPEIRGGASLQTVVDAVEQSALAQIAELEGASLQDVVDAVVDGALALAIDHPAETRVGLDVSSGVTIGPVPVQRAADIAVAANPTGGGDVSVTVDHTDADGNLFVSDSPISAATSAQSATVARHGTHVRIDLSGTDTSVNFHLDTHE